MEEKGKAVTKSKKFPGKQNVPIQTQNSDEWRSSYSCCCFWCRLLWLLLTFGKQSTHWTEPNLEAERERRARCSRCEGFSRTKSMRMKGSTEMWERNREGRMSRGAFWRLRDLIELSAIRHVTTGHCHTTCFPPEKDGGNTLLKCFYWKAVCIRKYCSWYSFS